MPEDFDNFRDKGVLKCKENECPVMNRSSRIPIIVQHTAMYSTLQTTHLQGSTGQITRIGRNCTKQVNSTADCNMSHYSGL
jgi:hypothetical protein